MKKLNYLMKTAVLICLTVFMLAGCGKKELTVENLVGSWTFYEETSGGVGISTTYTFNSDGTMSTSLNGLKMNEGTYSIDGDTINYTVTAINLDITDSNSLNVKLGDDRFTVTYDSGDKRTFYKMQ